MTLIDRYLERSEHYANQALRHIVTDPELHEELMRQADEFLELAELVARVALEEQD